MSHVRMSSVISLSLSRSLPLSTSLYLPLSLSLSYTHTLSLYLSRSLSLSLSLSLFSLALSLSLSLSHLHTLSPPLLPTGVGVPIDKTYLGGDCESNLAHWGAGCNVLQCAVVCCSVLQCVAGCCRVLQCVVVCGTCCDSESNPAHGWAGCSEVRRLSVAARRARPLYHSLQKGPISSRERAPYLSIKEPCIALYLHKTEEP